MADKSPPTAPKAPLIALYRAVPVMLSTANLSASSTVVSCACNVVIDSPTNRIEMYFFIDNFFKKNPMT